MGRTLVRPVILELYSSFLRQYRSAAIDLPVGVQITFAEIDAADPLSAVKLIFVLIANDLEAGRITLLGNINRPTQENFPAAEPPLAVFREYRFLVALPIVIPELNSLRVMDADILDAVNFKSGFLQTFHDE